MDLQEALYETNCLLAKIAKALESLVEDKEKKSKKK